MASVMATSWFSHQGVGLEAELPAPVKASMAADSANSLNAIS